MSETAEREITTQDRRDWSRLRSLFIEPSEVELMTDTSDITAHRWMTDKYVMLDVTDAPGVGEPQDAPDGIYRLTATKGLVPLDRLAGRDPAAVLSVFEIGADWHELEETRWTVRDDRALLMYVRDPVGHQCAPLAIDRDIYDAFKTAYEDAIFQATIIRGHSIRMLPRLAGDPDQKVWDYLDGRRTLAPVAYIQPIRIPDGIMPDGTYDKSQNETHAAQAIVNLTIAGKAKI